MDTKEDYIKELEKNMDKYKNKISKVDSLLANYNSSNKAELLNQHQSLKHKFVDCGDILKEIKSAGEEEYEQIKEKSSEIFEDIKNAFEEFSSFLTMEQLCLVKDEIVDFGNEKLAEVQELLKQHPLTAAASALILGFIIGTLFTRSK